tara:strand:+ start:415 stop:1191 length:777 start_codon:yes stop_codon:yes gene_type:complete
MFKKKFQDLNYISNFQKKNDLKKLLVFPGIGCDAKDYDFLFDIKHIKYQIFIFELPGHNKTACNLKNDYLISYAKKIFVFLKKNNIKVISIYTHSMSCLIIILMIRFFLGNKFFIRQFINNEGNLIESDASIVTKKTISYDFDYYNKIGFSKLINICSVSNDIAIRKWSKTLNKVSSTNFYYYSKSIYQWSKKIFLLSFFKNRFKKKIYLYGYISKNQNLLDRLSGIMKFCFMKSGHFSHLTKKKELKYVIIKTLRGS